MTLSLPQAHISYGLARPLLGNFGFEANPSLTIHFHLVLCKTVNLITPFCVVFFICTIRYLWALRSPLHFEFILDCQLLQLVHCQK